MPFATTVNVRDRLAGFIVSLATVADRWEMRPSADKDRFRQGLGRSTDSKVVALRQAVLEKCVAVKGPSPGQGAPSAVLVFLTYYVPVGHVSDIHLQHFCFFQASIILKE